MFNSLPRSLYLIRCNSKIMIAVKKNTLTLIAMVLIDAMTSRDPPRTRLPGNSGSYTYMAVVFSTAAILVIWPMMATFAMLTTCPKHLCKKGLAFTNMSSVNVP